MLPPLPSNTMSLLSVEIALAKFDIKVPINGFVSAILEEEAKGKLSPTITFLFPFNPFVPLVALHGHPPEPPTEAQFTPTSKFISNPPKLLKVEPLAKERRRRLIELSKETFPDGKVPADPFTRTLSQN